MIKVQFHRGYSTTFRVNGVSLHPTKFEISEGPTSTPILKLEFDSGEFEVDSSDLVTIVNEAPNAATVARRYSKE